MASIVSSPPVPSAAAAGFQAPVDSLVSKRIGRKRRLDLKGPPMLTLYAAGISIESAAGRTAKRPLRDD